MKYAFLGNPRFAEIILKKLIKDFQKPEIVICNPDRPTGRKKVITSPETKIIAQKNNIRVYQSSNLTSENWKENVGEVDICILAAYGKIIPDEVINSIDKGIIGVHPSLLPKYRGPTPIQSAILNGEEKTGTTLYLIDKDVDHGPVISQKLLNIYNESYLDLEEKLANLSAELIIETLPKYLSGKIEPEEQDHKRATFTEKFSTNDSEIEFNLLEEALKGDIQIAKEVDRKIRALNPEPGTWTIPNNEISDQLPKDERIKLLGSEIKNGKLVLNKIQVAGKKSKEVKISL